MKQCDKKNHRKLFADLKAWSANEANYSLTEFLHQKAISFDEFKSIAINNDKFLQIIGEAHCRFFYNLSSAWKKNKITRNQFAEHLKTELGIKNPGSMIEVIEQGDEYEF